MNTGRVCYTADPIRYGANGSEADIAGVDGPELSGADQWSIATRAEGSE